MGKVVLVLGVLLAAAACSPQAEVQPVQKSSVVAPDSLRVSDDELPADGNKPKG